MGSKQSNLGLNLAACTLAVLMLAGCTSERNRPSGETIDELTGLEREAIGAAAGAPASLAQSTGVARHATGDLDVVGKTRDTTAQLLPSTDFTFGTCPEVSKSGSLFGATGEGSLDLAIGFGDEPCTALAADEEFTYVCSGAAAGTFSLAGKSIELVFEDLNCNDQALDGELAVAFSLLFPGVELTGTWDITWQAGDDTLSTAGTGVASYVPATGGCCDVTSITEFTGTVTEAGDEWSIVIADIKMSLEQHSVFMPYAGSITLDGPDIRTLTITFSESSPETGEVSVSIDGGRAFAIELYGLVDWVEPTL